MNKSRRPIRVLWPGARANEGEVFVRAENATYVAVRCVRDEYVRVGRERAAVDGAVSDARAVVEA